jgi:hypothetical protein
VIRLADGRVHSMTLNERKLSPAELSW